MTKDEFIELIEDELDHLFPKGVDPARGKALALVATIWVKLAEEEEKNVRT